MRKTIVAALLLLFVLVLASCENSVSVSQHPARGPKDWKLPGDTTQVTNPFN